MTEHGLGELATDGEEAKLDGVLVRESQFGLDRSQTTDIGGGPGRRWVLGRRALVGVDWGMLPQSNWSNLAVGREGPGHRVSDG